MNDNITTAKYYTALPSRQCLICGALEKNYVATVVDAGIPWLCDRCRTTLMKLIADFNATQALSINIEAEESD